MNASRIIIALVFLFTTPALAAPVHPDEVRCDDNRKPRGWYMDTAGDFSGEDGRSFFAYYVYKWLSPRLEADCRTEEFFKGQDLDFGEKYHAVETLSLNVVGDIMARPRIDKTNGAYLYQDIQDELFGADILFGNFESPSHPQRPSHVFPSYNLSAEATRLYLGADRGQGFSVVSTANNHVLDQGEEGLLATLGFLDELGVAHVGSARSPDERDRGFPIMEANHIKVAFLAYTFSTNGRPVPQGREYEVNLINLNTMKGEPDISLIERHIKTARERGADVVAVSLHWGVEYELYPPRRFIDLGHRIADAGADLILGHHPHILNPMERYIPQGRSQGLPETLIVYSLGNFIPDHYKMEFQTTMILHITLARGKVGGEERVWIDGIDYTPVWWYCRMLPGLKEFRLINIDKALGNPDDYPFLRPRHQRELRAAKRFIDSVSPP